MDIPISEIFETIQGEGRHVGWPALFIRVAGCNLRCEWCDTPYALEKKQGDLMSEEQIIKFIRLSEKKLVVWTGGEPQLYGAQILRIRREIGNEKIFAVETNATLLSEFLLCYDYICFSPKRKEDIPKLLEFIKGNEFQEAKTEWDIKVVTDLEKVGMDMIGEATMLMPLTSNCPHSSDDMEVRKKVWEYCVKNNKKYSPRLQVEIFGKERGR